MKRRVTMGWGLLLAFCLFQPSPVVAADPVFGHAPLDAVLKEYVKEGRVAYSRLKAGRMKLDAYVESLDAIQPSEYAAWDDRTKIAFWINAYNAITLQVILDHYPITKRASPATIIYPVNSIQQIPGQWNKLTHRVMGTQMTLNNIEHETLRAQFKEPRIHMALVCGAKGCPPLRGEAYEGARLAQQLDDQARTYLSNPSAGLKIDQKKKTVSLSCIFQWFSEDFVKAYGAPAEFKGQSQSKQAVLGFVSRYISPEDQAFLKQEGIKVSFLSYDWGLNDDLTDVATR